VSGIPDLACVKQLGDQYSAHDLPPLTYEKYMDALLSACSSYDLLCDAPANSRRAVYSTTFYDDDPEYTDDPDADGDYQVYSVDTNIADINAHAVGTNRVNNDMSSSNCVPMAEWIKMTKEERDRLIAKRYQEKAHNKGGNKKPVQATRLANMHSIDSYVDLDVVIEYAVMEHEVHSRDDDADKDDNAEGTDLLAYMAGQHSYSGDI
jgi:hypothetical protein